MKIACICNMNNMMFILCRYLRDAGFDAHLFAMPDEPSHFHPEADSYEDSYKTYFYPFKFTRSTLYKKESVLELKRELGDFDFLIGSDIAPAVLTLIGRKLDVFIPHGSDIYALPFQQKRPKKTDRVWWQREIGTLSRLQALGIREIDHILFPDEYDIHFPFKNKLKTKAKYYNTSGPMVYINQYEDLEGRYQEFKLSHADEFKQIRSETPLMVFSHSRHNGFDLTGKMAVHDKGNDHLIKGFSQFIKESAIDARLVLFDYGINTKASKDLIKSLAIEANVKWMPLMDRKEIMYGLILSDISCGQFKNSWLTCGVVNESLAANKPLLHYRKDDLYTAEYSNLYPLMNANTPEEIASSLFSFVANRDHYRDEASQGSAWLYEQAVKNPLTIITGAVESKEKNSLFLPEPIQSEIKKVLKKHKLLDKIYRAQGKLRESISGK